MDIRLDKFGLEETQMTSKLRIRMGPIEVEYEGSEEFLKSEIPELIQAVSQIYAKSGLACTDSGADGSGSEIPPLNDKKITGTTRSIASKLSCKSGPDLVMAAAVKLTLVDGEGTISRKKLLDEMKTASGYYKASHRSNLSNCLKGLIQDGKLHEPSANNYSVGAATLRQMKNRLAN